MGRKKTSVSAPAEAVATVANEIKPPSSQELKIRAYKRWELDIRAIVSRIDREEAAKKIHAEMQKQLQKQLEKMLDEGLKALLFDAFDIDTEEETPAKVMNNNIDKKLDDEAQEEQDDMEEEEYQAEDSE